MESKNASTLPAADAVLVRDHSDGAYAVSVACLACGDMVRLCDALINPQGPSFRAYYHPRCVPGVAVSSSCNRLGCARRHEGSAPVDATV
jgi:hypothetical protein